jgi:hypothetical protein
VNHRHDADGRRHLRLHGDVVEPADLIEHGGDDGRDARFSRRGRQLQDPQVLHVGALAMRAHERVVGPSEEDRRIEVFPIAVPRERAGLTHQPPDDVAVVDAMLVALAQPRHRLHDLAPVPDLDDIGVHARFDRVAHQLRRHRVGAVRDANGAPPAYDRVIGRVAGNRGGGQGAERRPLLGQTGGHGPVAPVRDHLLDEGLVRGDGREVGMPSHQERLRDQRLQPAMRLLGDAVFVGLARRDPTGAHPVVLEHGAEPRREVTPPTRFQFVGRGRQIVAP